MSERQTRSSRHLQPSRNKKLDKLLNVLIGVVVVLIIITATYVFKWQDDADQAVKDEPAQEEKSGDKEKEVDKEHANEEDKDLAVDEEKPSQEEEEAESETSQEEQGTPEESTSDNPIVDKVITNKNWQPTPTTQTGQHVSSYDDTSVDWAEKVATVSTVTGIDQSNMIIWRMQNNGGPNSAIATVSSKDKSQMYRVSMEWVDNEGWLPVKLEQLNTLEGAY
ncbi:YrrS family protein [Lysinibacillus irui]|uniref:YrrS family protein n=1 Tax=Lysinibacillus irui TaxID=2998077 RepID=A0AAJ5US99_9BACI|nr:YrrS family protein [Lysinibacillus irui]WDV05653.1 YrrS family protein [Lysinibacillus irui]